MAIEVDQKLIFPDQFDLKENPDYDDALMIYDAKAGKVKQTKMEAIQAAAGNNVIGSMTPSGSPSGSEVEGQSYRVSNTTGDVLVFPNFLDSNEDPVQMEADETSGFITKNADGWAYVDATPEVDTSNLVAKSDLQRSSINLADTSKAVNDKAVNSAGSVITHTGSKYIELTNGIYPGLAYSINGLLASTIKYVAFINSVGIPIGTVSNLGTLPKQNLIAPALAAGIRFTVKNDTESDDSGWINTLMVNVGATSLPYVSPTTGRVDAIDGDKLEAESLVQDSQIPDPINPPNAVNLRYFNREALKVSGLVVAPGVNLANPAYFIPDKLIGNTGSEQNGVGWGYFRIPNLVVGRTYTFGGINITTSGYAAFLDASFQKIAGSSVISFTTGATRTAVVPEGTVYFGIDAMRPGDDPSVYANAMVNEGASLYTPFEPYREYIIKMGDYFIGGSSDVQSFLDLVDTPSVYTPGYLKSNDALNGLEFGDAPNPFDQMLNSTNNVQFAGLTIMGLKAILPSGATRPDGVESTDAWLLDDGTDDLTFKAAK